MKKYTFIVTGESDGLRFHRENDGFTLFEVMGFLEVLKNEVFADYMSNVQRVNKVTPNELKIDL